MKIDIEGAEIMALRGSYRILRSFKPVLIIEVHGESVGINSVIQAQTLYELLDRYNYSYFTLEAKPIRNRCYHHFLVPK